MISNELCNIECILERYYMIYYITEVIPGDEVKDSTGDDVPLLCSGGAVTSSPSAPCGGEHSRRHVYCEGVFFWVLCQHICEGVCVTER